MRVSDTAIAIFSIPRVTLEGDTLSAALLGATSIRRNAYRIYADTAVSRRLIPALAGPGTDFGRAVGEVRTGRVRRTRSDNRRLIPAVVGISTFAFGRAVVPFLHTAISQSNVGVVAADVAVVGVSHLADRGTGRGIIFGAAVLPFVNPGRTNAVGILSAAAVPGYRTRIRTIGRVVKIHIFADAAFVSAAAAGSLSDLI